eukprot:CAMPEP_0185854254 /NCGR_PEP_ID=MMETSP1354-20130828/21799_1 /TAXON_ID=708628 /ORGANISM="Erythrolobus madagascarensis, Strain CCMP3276" /LENGTH=126 /DNA_ID=CAMNT_0028555973 /DNA_START=44 /DNA_END=422 /DNA_ORIENTATION=-
MPEIVICVGEVSRRTRSMGNIVDLHENTPLAPCTRLENSSPRLNRGSDDDAHRHEHCAACIIPLLELEVKPVPRGISNLKQSDLLGRPGGSRKVRGGASYEAEERGWWVSRLWNVINLDARRMAER